MRVDSLTFLKSEDYGAIMPVEEYLSGLTTDEKKIAVDHGVFYRAEESRFSAGTGIEESLTIGDLERLVQMPQNHQAALSWLQELGGWHSALSVPLAGQSIVGRRDSRGCFPSQWWAEAGQIRRTIWLQRFLKRTDTDFGEYQRTLERRCQVVEEGDDTWETGPRDTIFQAPIWPDEHNSGWLKQPHNLRDTFQYPRLGEFTVNPGFTSEGETSESFLWRVLTSLVNDGLARFGGLQETLEWDYDRRVVKRHRRRASSLGAACWELLRQAVTGCPPPSYCDYCEKPILDAVRRNKKYCSDSCKSMAWRKRNEEMNQDG